MKTKKPAAKKIVEQIVEVQTPVPEPVKAAIGPAGMDLPRIPGPDGYQGVTFGGKRVD